MYINSDVTLLLAHTSFDVCFVSYSLAKKKKNNNQKDQNCDQKTLTDAPCNARLPSALITSGRHLGPGNDGRCGRYRNSSQGPDAPARL